MQGPKLIKGKLQKITKQNPKISIKNNKILAQKRKEKKKASTDEPPKLGLISKTRNFQNPRC